MQLYSKECLETYPQDRNYHKHSSMTSIEEGISRFLENTSNVSEIISILRVLVFNWHSSEERANYLSEELMLPTELRELTMEDMAVAEKYFRQITCMLLENQFFIMNQREESFTYSKLRSMLEILRNK